MEMDFQFVGQNIELTDALRRYAKKRVSKLLKYFSDEPDKVIQAIIKMKVEHERQTADIQLKGMGEFFEGRTTTPDMYASVDGAVDKLARQLRTYHDRVTDHRKKDLNGPNRELASKIFELDDEEDDGEPQIIKRDVFTAKPMSVEEAVLQMENMNFNFFVFTNQVTEDINVVYQRDDNNYGLIEAAS